MEEREVRKVEGSLRKDRRRGQQKRRQGGEEKRTQGWDERRKGGRK